MTAVTKTGPQPPRVPPHGRRLRHLLALIALASLPMGEAAASDGSQLLMAAGCCAKGVAVVLDPTRGSGVAPSASASTAPSTIVPGPIPPLEPCTEEPSAEQARELISQVEARAAAVCRAEEPQVNAVEANISFRARTGFATAVWFDPPLRGDDFKACMTRVFEEAKIDWLEGADATIVYPLGMEVDAP